MENAARALTMAAGVLIGIIRLRNTPGIIA